MPAFARHVREEKIIATSRLEMCGNHRARSRYETIHNDGYSARGCTENESCDRADFKASNLGKHVQSIARLRLVPSQCISNDFRFVAEPIIVDAGAAPNDFFNRQSGEDRTNRCARSRVPDPHITGSNKVVALSEVHSGFDGLHRLFYSHRRPFEKVLRASSDLSRHETR